MPDEIQLRLFDIQCVQVELFQHSHNTAAIFQCNYRAFLSEVWGVALIHCTICWTLNLLPVKRKCRCFHCRNTFEHSICIIRWTVVRTSSSISNRLISSVAVFKFSSSIYFYGFFVKKNEMKQRNQKHIIHKPIIDTWHYNILVFYLKTWID